MSTDSGSLTFGILGPVEASDASGPRALGGAKQRALLAVLLVHRGETVSPDRLIDALWGECPPPSAAKSLQVHVSHLRRALGPGVIATRTSGYRLELAPGALDLSRFESAVDQGRAAAAAGDARRASRLLAEGLAMWRGPPLADVAYEPFATPFIARLEELRLTALEDRLGADLAGGGGGELVAELRALVDEHPLRERLRAELMLALYRAARQAEALEVFREGRAALRDELGLEPGLELRALERDILDQHPRLGGPGARSLARAARRRGRALVAAGGVLAAVVAALAVVGIDRGDRSGPVVVPPGSAAEIDARTGTVLQFARVPGEPGAIAASRAAVWVASGGNRTVTGLSPRRLGVLTVVAPGALPADLAVGPRALWLLDRSRGAVVQVEPSYGDVVARMRLPSQARRAAAVSPDALHPWSIAAGDHAAWVTDGSSRLYLVDPARRPRVRTIDTGRPLHGVAVGAGSVWAVSAAAGRALRIDERTGRVLEEIVIAGGPDARSRTPAAVAVDDGAVWVLNSATARLTRIDPALHAVVATIALGIGHRPAQIAAGGGAAWIAGHDGTLTRVDARTNAATAFPVATRLRDVAVAGGRVWVTADAGPRPATATPARPAASRVTPLSRAICGPVEATAGVRPQVLIASDLPLRGGDPAIGQAGRAIRLALADRGFRAGRFAVGYQACDDSTAVLPADAFEARCAAMAHAYAADRSVLGVVGFWTSPCAARALPILNRAPGGPLAVVSSSSTYVGLTHAGPGVPAGQQPRLYPTGRRNFARLLPADDVQAAAQAVLIRRAGVRRLFVLHDGSLYGSGMAAVVRDAASALGIRVVGAATWDSSDATFASLGRRVAAGRADGVFFGGATTAPQVIKDVARIAGRRVALFAPGGDVSPQIVALAGAGAEGMTLTRPGIPVPALPRAGRRFAARLQRATGQEPSSDAIYTAEAANVLLDAIARSDGTRASVSRELLRLRVRGGLLGDYRISASGDATGRAVAVYRIQRGLPRLLEVMTPPARLTGRR